MKLNFKNITKKENIDEPIKQSSSAMKLKLSSDKIYDLDEIISKKRRDNDESSILVQVDFSSEVSKSILYHIAKLVLTDHNVGFNDDNFKDQVNLVPDFITKYEEAVHKYYKIYANNKYKLTNGKISLETIEETISFAHTNYDEYLRNNGLITSIDGYLDVTDTRPSVNIIEGTQENDEGPIIKYHNSIDIIQTLVDKLVQDDMYYLCNTYVNNSFNMLPGLYTNINVPVYDVRSEKCLTKYSETMLFPETLENKGSMMLVFDIYTTVDIINSLTNIRLGKNDSLFLDIKINEISYTINIPFIDGVMSSVVVFKPVNFNQSAIFSNCKIDLRFDADTLISTESFLKFDFYAVQTNIDMYIYDNTCDGLLDFIKDNNYCIPFALLK